jgi:hypothetical protein
MERKLARLAFGLVLTTVMFTGPAQAANLDIRGGAYTGPDFDKPFAGVGLDSHLSGSLYFNPNVEYVFVDNGRFGTLNFDAHYVLPLDGPISLWLGAGLGLAHTDPEGEGGSETKPRANIIFGLGFGNGRSSPYIQGKYLTGYKYWVIAAGIRF